MVYKASVVEIMIASPSDVADERHICRNIISGWNDVNARRQGIVLLPIGWESHVSPEIGGRPQQLINEKILERADILIGIFWSRLGTPTGKAVSGTVEEIEEHIAKGKPAMLYFSKKPILQENIDTEQLGNLKKFTEGIKARGLIEEFVDEADFTNKFRRHLEIKIAEGGYSEVVERDQAERGVMVIDGGSYSDVSNDARSLIKEAADDKNGIILIRETLGGTSIITNDKEFAKPTNARAVARWRAAVEDLLNLGYVEDIDGRRNLFRLTHSGYRFVEQAGNQK